MRVERMSDRDLEALARARPGGSATAATRSPNSRTRRSHRTHRTRVTGRGLHIVEVAVVVAVVVTLVVVAAQPSSPTVPVVGDSIMFYAGRDISAALGGYRVDVHAGIGKRIDQMLPTVQDVT